MKSNTGVKRKAGNLLNLNYGISLDIKTSLKSKSKSNLKSNLNLIFFQKSLNFCLLLYVILILLLISSPPVSCSSNVFILPSNVSNSSDGLYRGENNFILYVNLSGFQGGQIEVIYNKGCVNISNLKLNESFFPFGGWDSSIDGREWVTFASMKVLSGNYAVANLRLNCEINRGEICSAKMGFGNKSAIFDQNGDKMLIQLSGGIVECRGGELLFSELPFSSEPFISELSPDKGAHVGHKGHTLLEEVDKKEKQFMGADHETSFSLNSGIGGELQDTYAKSGSVYTGEYSRNDSAPELIRKSPLNSNSLQQTPNDYVDANTNSIPGFKLKTFIFSFLTILILRRYSSVS